MYEKMEKKLQNIFGKNVHINSVRFFESKKNQVALIELNNCGGQSIAVGRAFRPAISKIIMKTFIWGEQKKEEEILKKLYELGIAVPKIIKSRKDILFLEYIPGENLRTLYNKEKNPYTKTARKYDAMIARWLGNFHKTFAKKDNVLLKGDMHLQNFIFQPISSPHRGEEMVSGSEISPLPFGERARVRGILFGVDFEESSYGAPEYDLAQLFAVFLTQIIRTTVAAGFSLRKNDIVKHKKRVENFIKIYTEISGTSVNKNIDKLIKQELAKISTYLPHLKNNINEMIKRLL